MTIALGKFTKDENDLFDIMDDWLRRDRCILLFITCVYYLGRMPSPILTKKLKGISEAAEVGESEEERNIEIETISEGGV